VGEATFFFFFSPLPKVCLCSVPRAWSGNNRRVAKSSARAQVRTQAARGVRRALRSTDHAARWDAPLCVGDGMRHVLPLVGRRAGPVGHFVSFPFAFSGGCWCGAILCRRRWCLFVLSALRFLTVSQWTDGIMRSLCVCMRVWFHLLASCRRGCARLGISAPGKILVRACSAAPPVAGSRLRRRSWRWGAGPSNAEMNATVFVASLSGRTHA
jgi:hypothetical protein